MLLVSLSSPSLRSLRTQIVWCVQATPDRAPLFVSPNLWQYIEDDDKSEYCIMVSSGSQTFMGAE